MKLYADSGGGVGWGGVVVVVWWGGGLGLTLTDRALHVPHDQTVLVVQELDADLCDLHSRHSTSSEAAPGGCQTAPCAGAVLTVNEAGRKPHIPHSCLFVQGSAAL